MSDSRSLTPAESSEYELIEAAFGETARGRWFLAEYARRNRTAETEMLLQAIGRLENAVVKDHDGGGFGRFHGDLMEMADAIARTKSEIAAINAPANDQNRLLAASEVLDGIVRQTEKATSNILGAAEEVQEAAWMLREARGETELCESLDRHATRIYTACSFQDLTAQRIGRVLHTLRYLEKRIDSMLSIWGTGGGPAAEAPKPAASRAQSEIGDLCQSDVDSFLSARVPDVEPNVAARSTLVSGVALDQELAYLPEPEAQAVPAPPSAAAPPYFVAAPQDDLASAFDDLDALSIEEKIALFT